MAKNMRLEKCYPCRHYSCCRRWCEELDVEIANGMIHPDCPLPDTDPAPYSAENSPKVKDVVSTYDGDIGMIAFLGVPKEGEPTMHYVAIGGVHVGFYPGDLTLIFRPQGEPR